MTELRHASFFSGVGGLDLGFERAGIRTVSLCEFEPYASAVLSERFPGVPNFGDITKLREEDIPDAEIYSGGFPCQDLSSAGSRKGFADGTRSSLAFRFLNIVERRRPRWVVLENVPGLFTSNRGRDFLRLIREMESVGYGLAWRTLDAQFFGVPQRRRRVFVVAADDSSFGGVGGERAAEVLFECQGACGHLTTGGSTREETSEGTSRGPGATRRSVGDSSTNADGMRIVNGVAEGLDDRAEVETPERMISFPSRFGMNAKFTEGVAQSFAHSAGAPAVMSFPRSLSQHATKFNDQADPLTVNRGGGINTPAFMRTGTSFDGFNQSLNGDGAHRTLRIGRDSSDFVVPPSGWTEGDDDLMNPTGWDSNRYRCIGNGVVSPVAEFIGRRLVAVHNKYVSGTVAG